MTNEDEIEYELSMRYAPLKGNVVSRRTVEDLIGCIIEAPDMQQHANLGVNKQNTDRGRAVLYAAYPSVGAQRRRQQRTDGGNRICDWKVGEMRFFSNPSVTSHNLYYVK
ncbi:MULTISPECIES: hypothetical protein [unclassified Janthinobacterium]|uniref:hypothetical protein n=1 Tax=unclassified Janthinobacterium TaxID=2610881 RepID=UPI0018C94FB7|nr:hypothetical protein [Janthinobacterium sp. CG_23.4]MDH6158105.1 hypothetical protein [Janthinobacterium sp. CG_23.4]